MLRGVKVENRGIEITCVILVGCLHLSETPQLLIDKGGFSYQLYRMSASSAVVFNVVVIVYWE